MLVNKTTDTKNPDDPDDKDLDTIFTVPNFISAIRLLLVPGFFILLLEHYNVVAFLVFVVAASTDWLDGYIARKTSTVSKFGRQLDPLIDRILIAASVIGLSIVGYLPLWCAILLLLRDIVMLSGFFLAKVKYKTFIAVKFSGKVATALLFIGFAGLMLQWPTIPGLELVTKSWLPGWGTEGVALGMWFVYLGMVFSLLTAGFYVFEASKVAFKKSDGL